jgi:hypothetical protein
LVENIDYAFFKNAWKHPSVKTRAALGGHFGISLEATKPDSKEKTNKESESEDEGRVITNSDIPNPHIAAQLDAVIKNVYKVSSYADVGTKLILTGMSTEG